MIINYQLGKFSFTEYDEDWNEHSYIWKISEFYSDFPFLPQLNFREIDSISFEDDRDLYLITYHPKLKKEAVGGCTTPDIHPFLKALNDNKNAIKARAYELMNQQSTPHEPAVDVITELTALKKRLSKLEDDVGRMKSR